MMINNRNIISRLTPFCFFKAQSSAEAPHLVVLFRITTAQFKEPPYKAYQGAEACELALVEHQRYLVTKYSSI